MGQSWRIVNIDKLEGWEYREGVFYYGYPKLGEFFFTSNPKLLKCLVTLPTPVDSPAIGRWAGDRIICVGGYTMGLPPGVLTKADAYAPLLKELCRNPDPGNFIYENCDNIVYGLEEHAGSMEDPKVFPPNAVWVLRNLSKKEFVRSDKIGKEPYKPDNHNAFEDPLGFFQVIVARIGWSEDDSTSMPYNREGYQPPSGRKQVMLNEGPWAGDRLDIVMFGLTGEVLNLLDEGWTDVSEEAAAQLEDIRVSEED